MSKKKDKKLKELEKEYPFVSLCTPTFNRRPFVKSMIQCFNHQTYPKDRIEWIIVDDGTDKIEDLVSHIPQVKYLKFDEKMTLGKKRNVLNDTAKGDIIVYMDDDDYYPPERITHSVEMLQKTPNALCAGSSEMFIYFKHINKMYKFGPYGPNHATAATFAFKKELLLRTRFDESSSVAEEKKFLKDYTIPFVQLDSKKSILVFSHIHNSFDKKELLQTLPNSTIHETSFTPFDFVKDTKILNFFMKEIEPLLDSYEPGKPMYKPDVTKQLKEIKEQRELMIKQHQEQQQKQHQQNFIIQQLSSENQQLKEKIQYLEDKIKQIITEKIQEKMKDKHVVKENIKKDVKIELSNLQPIIINE
jgi:glycosyltransferase involved in cell wall biosynthesis